jgi:hypothetical protein
VKSGDLLVAAAETNRGERLDALGDVLERGSPGGRSPSAT